MCTTITDEYRKQAVFKTIDYLIVHNNYKFVKKIGRGTYGEVVEMLCPDKHRRVAVKIVVQELVSESEKKLWPDLAHENLLPLITAADVPSTHCYVFLTPLCPSDLQSFVIRSVLSKEKEGFTKALSWLQAVCSGLKYMHEKQLCHLDIKLANVLISEEGKALLCDFGALTNTEGATNSYCSPLMYRPPEGIHDASGNQAVVNGFQYDVYTIGMLCLELFTEQAFDHSEDSGQTEPRCAADLYPKIFDILQKDRFEVLVKKAFRKSKVKRKMLCDLRDFIRGCMNLNPKKRPSADDLLEHKIFGGEKSFRKLKYDAWLNRWDVKKLQFLVDLYIGSNVMLEFQCRPHQTNVRISDGQKKNSDDKENVQIKDEVIIPSSDTDELENIAESKPVDEVKKNIADNENADQEENEEISTCCGSCQSNESEFIEIKTKKNLFYDWIGRRKSGIIKAFNRLCCGCCRKKKNVSD